MKRYLVTVSAYLMLPFIAAAWVVLSLCIVVFGAYQGLRARLRCLLGRHMWYPMQDGSGDRCGRCDARRTDG